LSRLAINGVHYNFEEAGEGSPLLLLHGFTGSEATWESNLPAFKPYFRVVTVDLPGHGASDAPADPQCYSIEQTAAAIAAILDSLKIAKAAVLGYSMGGRVALYFAVHYPERVERLILESASPGLPTGQERADRAASDEALAGFIEQKGLVAFVDHWEKLPLFASQANLPEEVRAALRRQRLQNRPTGLAHSLRGIGTGQQPSLWENLAGLSCPALLLTGELDPKFKAIGQQMQVRLPAARLEIVGGAGHTIHLEKPREFENLVKGFLTGDV
jgi:2-succinyl-6-hydroxy-2,4-cyclohexadiene-1-carboxylate synthase